MITPLVRYCMHICALRVFVAAPLHRVSSPWGSSQSCQSLNDVSPRSLRLYTLALSSAVLLSSYSNLFHQGFHCHSASSLLHSPLDEQNHELSAFHVWFSQPCHLALPSCFTLSPDTSAISCASPDAHLPTTLPPPACSLAASPLNPCPNRLHDVADGACHFPSAATLFSSSATFILKITSSATILAIICTCPYSFCSTTSRMHLDQQSAPATSPCQYPFTASAIAVAMPWTITNSMLQATTLASQYKYTANS